MFSGRNIFMDPVCLGSCQVFGFLRLIQYIALCRCFLITHSHLDHVNSLVLSAGSLSGSSRHVFGASRTLKDLEGIFSDRIWPKLASWNEDDSLPLIFSP